MQKMNVALFHGVSIFMQVMVTFDSQKQPFSGFRLKRLRAKNAVLMWYACFATNLQL